MLTPFIPKSMLDSIKDPYAFRLLCVLWSFANNDQHEEVLVWPSFKKMESDTGYCHSTVVTQLKKLVELGLVQRTGKRRGKGGSTIYKLMRFPVVEDEGNGTKVHASLRGRPVGQTDQSTSQTGLFDNSRLVGETDRQTGLSDRPRSNLIEVTSDKVSKNTSVADYDKSFDQFWSQYPIKAGKKVARKAFGKVLRAGVKLEKIMSGLDLYKRCKPPTQEFAHPGTWLNQNRWEDEWSESSVTSRRITLAEKFGEKT